MINAELARKKVEAFHDSAAMNSLELANQIQNKAINIFDLISNRIFNRIGEASSTSEPNRPDG